MTEIECQFCNHKHDVDEGDVNDEDGELDGFACPECGAVSYYERRKWS